MRVQDGLVGLADTRVTTGSECITAKKVSSYQQDGAAMFLMTSGLRSVRDKALTYFDEIMESEEAPTHGRLFHVANLFAEQIRRVAREDREYLEHSQLPFNIHTLLGGQLEHDREHKLYMIYPEGNWVEIGQGTPYHIIGASGYGKPVLDRTLKYEDTMQFALTVGCLAFDSTRISASDVDFPLDVVLYRRDARELVEHRYNKDDLAAISEWWQDRLRNSVRQMPLNWMDPLLAKLDSKSAIAVQFKGKNKQA
jgi:putative proteasome-type protease